METWQMAEVPKFALDDAAARLAGWRLQNPDVAETQISSDFWPEQIVK